MTTTDHVTADAGAAGDLLERIERLARLDAEGRLFDLDALPALTALRSRIDALEAERDALRRQSCWLRDKLLRRTAARVARSGCRRIALYGAGYHTAPIVRQPWRDYGLEVIAIIDDDRRVSELGGAPVLHPDDLPREVDAVVVSSDRHEGAIYRRAVRRFGARGIHVFPVYNGRDGADSPERTKRILTQRFGVQSDDAEWLIANRMERHDATLPMLPGRRTELHLRRYEFAMARAGGKRVVDAACGTGYGSRMLADRGGATSVLGVDMDARTIDYATRRHNAPGVTFARADVTELPAGDRSVDLVVSFETIEHVREPEALLAELARVLAPGGSAIVSTPNDAGPTPHHFHSFTSNEFRRLLLRRFLRVEDWGQTEQDEPRWNGQPPGMYPLTQESPRADYLVSVVSEPKA